MRRLFFFFLIIILTLTSLGQPLSYTLIHVNVVNVTSGKIEWNVNVGISGNRIITISRDAPKPTWGRQIDASSKFLIPGLWDMHVHIRGQDKLFFPLLITNGITGIRDMHNPRRCFTMGKWRDSINRSGMIAPRIGAVAGCIVDEPGDGRNYGFLEATNAQMARDLVDSLKHSGSDFIKVYEHISPDVYATLIDEAKKQNIPVAGHIPLFMRAIDCAAAGQKNFEHLENFHQYCSTRELEIVTAYRDSFQLWSGADFNRIAQLTYDSFDSTVAVSFCNNLRGYGVYVDPTLVIDMPVSCRKDLEYKNVLSKKNIPAAIELFFDNKGDANGEDSLMIHLFQRQLEILGYLHRAKVNIIAGTDMSDIHNVVPGFSIHDELELYVAAGLTPLEALRTATINPAVFLGKDHDLGTVQTGKLADLVLLDANPLDNITNINSIFAVIQNGHFLDRKKLGAMIANTALNIGSISK